jgi:hypothetical protein
MDLIEVDPRLREASRRFAGLNNYIETLGDEDLEAMILAQKVATMRAFSMRQAEENLRAFAVFSGQTAMMESLVMATNQGHRHGCAFGEVVLYPAAHNHLRSTDACPVIRIQTEEVEEVVSKGAGMMRRNACKKIRVGVEVAKFKALVALPRQFNFRSDAAQPWARQLYAKGLAALKRCTKPSDAIDLMIPAPLRRKLVAFLLYPEFTAKPRVPAAALTHLFKDYEVQVRATNVRDLFDRMQITELNRSPRTRKQSRRRQHA